MDNDVLDEAYERLRRTGPEFGRDEEGRNSLSNHGPMAVEVLARRGHGAIKFTDTAVELYERTGDPDALAACARSMQLMAPARRA
jgi:hypothetical protein